MNRGSEDECSNVAAQLNESLANIFDMLPTKMSDVAIMSDNARLPSNEMLTRIKRSHQAPASIKSGGYHVSEATQFNSSTTCIFPEPNEDDSLSSSFIENDDFDKTIWDLDPFFGTMIIDQRWDEATMTTSDSSSTSSSPEGKSPRPRSPFCSEKKYPIRRIRSYDTVFIDQRWDEATTATASETSSSSSSSPSLSSTPPPPPSSPSCSSSPTEPYPIRRTRRSRSDTSLSPPDRKLSIENVKLVFSSPRCSRRKRSNGRPPRSVRSPRSVMKVPS